MQGRWRDLDAWMAWRKKRAERRKMIGSFASVVAWQVILLALWAHLARGGLAHHSWSSVGEIAVVVVLAVSVIALLVSPASASFRIEKILSLWGRFFAGVITWVLLSAVFIVAWPFGMLFGKSRYRRDHPQSAMWLGGAKGSWRTSSWVKKEVDIDDGESSDSSVVRLVGYFAARRNVLVLIVVIAALIAASLSVFVHTSYLAPFLYPFF